MTVTTMAGHWSRSTIIENTQLRVADPAVRFAPPTDECSCRSFRNARLPSLHQSSRARDATGTSHSARTASFAPASLYPSQLSPQTCARALQARLVLRQLPTGEID